MSADPTGDPTVDSIGEVREVDGGGPLTMVRAALPTIPGLNLVPGVRKTSRRLPDFAVRREAEVERDRVASYARVCGFPEKDVAPLVYPHLLAFGLHMALMTDPAFPFPAIGTVHLANAITQHRPVAIGERLTLTARAVDLRAGTKGRVFDIVVTGAVGAETVWESTSTYLRLGGGDREHGDAGPAYDVVPVGGIPWRLPADLGRRYAAVSGDHNPIHLYPLTARAFGFKRQIVHGMWSKARVVAAVENRLPDAVRVEVAFKKPIFLPGTVSLGVHERTDGLDLTLAGLGSGAPHLVGRTVDLP